MNKFQHDFPIPIKTWYYQQFDADPDAEIPGEAYGGWKHAQLEISAQHTALVVMHAWDMGTAEDFPGWHRAVEYIPRAQAILRDVFPPLLAAVRQAGFPIVHVVGGGDYYKKLPDYFEVLELAGPQPPLPPPARSDYVAGILQDFRRKNVFTGAHNEGDIKRGFERVDFPPEARPELGEPIVESSHQLLTLCRARGYNHLIYSGFAINWCLLLSPGGMADMSRHNILCSALRQAVTAVENKETARNELCKEIALWRVALAFGFVYDVPDFIDAMHQLQAPRASVPVPGN